MSDVKNVDPIISYRNLRRSLGILGILLPLVCFFGGLIISKLPLQQSISFYYYTNVRDFFVGFMVCMSVFLITYKGYGVIDNIVTSLSGIFGLGIAVFPCLFSETSIISVGFFQINSVISNIIHIICSIIFFFLLSFNSIFLFTRTDKTKPVTKNKKVRNIIYIICGIVILVSFTTLLILTLTLGQKLIIEKCIVFYFEAIMLSAFGLSWLVKGETIFRDE
jgi:hypothetical protein